MVPDDRQNANPAPYRAQVQTARQAAEALFKSKPQAAPVEVPTLPIASPIPSTEHDAPRKPRIFSAVPATSAPADEPTSSALTQRRSDTRRKAQKIPTSAHGRIKTLTTYGMTIGDVAEFYGVPVSDIARIVSSAK